MKELHYVIAAQLLDWLDRIGGQATRTQWRTFFPTRYPNLSERDQRWVLDFLVDDFYVHHVDFSFRGDDEVVMRLKERGRRAVKFKGGSRRFWQQLERQGQKKKMGALEWLEWMAKAIWPIPVGLLALVALSTLLVQLLRPKHSPDLPVDRLEKALHVAEQTQDGFPILQDSAAIAPAQVDSSNHQ